MTTVTSLFPHLAGDSRLEVLPLFFCLFEILIPPKQESLATLTMSFDLPDWELTGGGYLLLVKHKHEYEIAQFCHKDGQCCSHEIFKHTADKVQATRQLQVERFCVSFASPRTSPN